MIGRRRFSPFLVAGILAVASAACGGDRAETWAEARERGAATIRVLYEPVPRIIAPGPGGEPGGVAADVVRAFADYVSQQHGVTLALEFVEEPDAGRLHRRVRSARGGVLGVGNIFNTVDRRAEVGVAPPYMTNVAVLATHASVLELDRPEALGTAFSGMTAITTAGSVHEQRLAGLLSRYAPAILVEPVASDDAVIAALTADSTRFGYLRLLDFWQALEGGAPLRRHRVLDLAGEEYAIIYPPDSDWAEPLAEFLLDGGFTATPAYREILARHLGAELAAEIEAAERRFQGVTP